MKTSTRFDTMALLATALFLGQALAFETTFKFDSRPEVETRSIDAIYKAALAEGGVVTVWHGGDETTQQDALKKSFEEAFPGMKLNLTVDLSKYHDGLFDEQLATGNVYVDSIILQTLQDFPRWSQEGALMNYAPHGFDQIFPAFKDSTSAAWYGYRCFGWEFFWNTNKIPGVQINEFTDFLKPELKNRLVLTYPNDDDAVAYAFHLIMQHFGKGWFDSLLKQNPVWVRGTATPYTMIAQPNSTVAATFTTFAGFQAPKGFNISLPTQGQFVSWAQRGAIPKDAPHPEGAKLLMNYLLTKEFQATLGWTVRMDMKLPEGFPFRGIMGIPSTNPTGFATWMADRARAEQLKLWFEKKIGTAQGLSPLDDDL